MLIVWEYISVPKETRLRVGEVGVRFVWSVGRLSVILVERTYGHASADWETFVSSQRLWIYTQKIISNTSVITMIINWCIFITLIFVEKNGCRSHDQKM